ncbi:hypothetical protein AVEN_218358-1, partial [Araneus ventricosus]
TRCELKNGNHDSSDTEIGVLIAITSHGQTPPKGGMLHHRSGVTQPIPLLYPSGKREPAYLSGYFSYTCWWCLPMGEHIS